MGAGRGLDARLEGVKRWGLGGGFWWSEGAVDRGRLDSFPDLSIGL